MSSSLFLVTAIVALSGVSAQTAQAQVGNRVGSERPAQTKYTSEQLKRYALALLQIQKVKQTLAVRMESASEAEKPMLRSQAKFENRAILQRYDLDVSTFNEMTNAVDSRPTVRGKVRQTVMQQTLALWK